MKSSYLLYALSVLFLLGEEESLSSNSAHQSGNPLDISQDLPLEINSENGIVCEKEKNICIASVNVIASHGDYVLNCDTLIAYFREGKDKKTELWQVEAQGNVILHSIKDHRVAYAQHGFYTLDDEHAILTGDNLKLEVDDLTVTATDALEYFKSKNIAFAKGDAVAVKKDQMIKGETLISYFREGKDKKTELWQLEALENVTIQSTTDHHVAYAQHGLYTLDDEHAVLTGDNLKLEVDDLTVTARDSLEYFKNKNIAFAKGNAAATKENRLIKGEMLKAYFGENNEGKQYIKKIEAFENVLISTETEIATGDYGRYLKDEDFAILEGNVKISREDGQMDGQYAEVKLDTGVSKMLHHSSNASENPKKKDGRVHVLLLPKQKKAP